MKNRFKTAAMIVAVLAGSAGIAAAQDYRYYDRDGDRYQDRDDYRYDNFRRGMHVAREIGYRDGAEVARQDTWRGKPFNPNPRGRFDDADHGYQREFGSKHEYREHYIDAYRDGYQRNYRGNDRYYR
jgi:hypothetical protein